MFKILACAAILFSSTALGFLKAADFEKRENLLNNENFIKKAPANLVENEKNKLQEEKELFRLPIDRVFTMEGFGTVITGTLLEGSVKVGDEIMIYPGEQIAKVRGIQNHNAAEETAFAGQRTAINLTGVKKEDINRGDVLAVKDGLPLSNRMDVKVRLFDDTRRQLKSHDHVHISYGSAQTVCKVVLLDRDILASGEEGLAQLIFDQPVPARHGDKFILRFYSPVESFAGGTVLEPEARKHKKICSTSFIIREMKNKITMRYHFTPARMAIIQKSTNNKC